VLALGAEHFPNQNVGVYGHVNLIDAKISPDPSTVGFGLQGGTAGLVRSPDRMAPQTAPKIRQDPTRERGVEDDRAKDERTECADTLFPGETERQPASGGLRREPDE
jgi:hypothetical protein